MKHCIKCNEKKSRSEFHKDSLRKDKLFPYCKQCRLIPRKPAKCRPASEVLSDYNISNSGCWEWAGVINVDGYGMACYKGKVIRAHRLSFQHFKGEIKNELLVLHKCDNRKCINPDHLYAGTNQDNSNDMVNRNRHVSRKGEDSPLSKLTKDQVKSIFNDKRKHKLIASDYDIAASTVSGIKTKKRWKHVTQP